MSLRPDRAWLSRVAGLEAILVMALGAVVVIGWHAGLSALVQVRPAFVPMQYNTALGFLLVGGALWGAIRGHVRTAFAMGLGGALIGLLTLTQDLFTVELGIDQLLMVHDITVGIPHPGRMAPNTALAFLLAGAAIAASTRLHSRRSDWILGLTGSIVSGLGLIALFGYWSGLEAVYTWGQLTRMAVHTSVGCVLIGSGLALVATEVGINRRAGKRLPNWLPISFGLVMLTLSLSMWGAIGAASGGIAPILPAVVGILGIIGSILTATTGWYAMAARARAQEAEEANKELAKWHQLFMHAGWGIIIADARTNKMISVNPAFAKMHGGRVEEFEGTLLADVVSEEHRPLLKSRIAEVHSTGQVEYESRNVRKDGSTFPVQTSVVLIPDENGQPLYRAANVQDITERQRISKLLEESEQRFRSLNEVAPVGVYLTDAAGQCTFVNRRWIEMTGIALDSALGDGWRGALHPEDREAVLSVWSEMIDTKGQCGMEYRIRQPSGETTWVFGLASAVRDPEGTITGYVGAHVDITQRKESEDLLRQKEAQLSTILQASPDRVWLLDGNLNILYGNEAAMRGAVGHIGSSVFTALDERRHEEAKHHLERALLCNESYRYEATLENTDGTASIFDNVAAPIRANGHVDGLAIISRDVTEDRRNAYHNQHADRLSAIGKLAAGIAHDFNNVMGVISLYTKLVIKDGSLNAKSRDRLDTVLENCDHAKNLTQQILDYGRRGVLDRQPTDLAALIMKMFKLLGHSLPKNIVLTPVLGKNVSLVSVDPGRLRQAILNLALNARDSMPEGGELRIELDEVHVRTLRDAPVPDMPPGRWVGITVSDTGRGIKEDQFNRIFEPFFTTKDLGSGTGLGLSQVYGIIKQHGGHLDVTTKEGSGTTFYLYLPAL